MDNYYELHVAGLTRQLPICKVDEELSIAAFILFSDVELTVACAKTLLERAPEFDVIVTAEAKGIPLAYEMSRESGKNYYICRKSTKLYMKDPITVEVKSITTAKTQTLYLDSHEAEFISGKRVLIVDDVISTGGSLRSIEAIMKEIGGNIVGKAAVLAEGVAADRDDLIFLAPLPVFNTKDYFA
ncbi:MAG: phosphoribosyltransferase family protein [Oscillospiraceae bacterium]|nr:phosphoribosyltransferase family protein [Oscillospiraceae bacterium]